MNESKKLTIRIKFPSTQNDPAQENNPSNFHRGRIIGFSFVFILIMAAMITGVFYYFNQDNSADINIKSPTVAESPDKKQLPVDQDAAQSSLQNANNESALIPDQEEKISEPQGVQPTLTEITDPLNKTAQSVDQDAAQSSLQNETNEGEAAPEKVEKSASQSDVYSTSPTEVEAADKIPLSTEQIVTQGRSQNTDNESATASKEIENSSGQGAIKQTTTTAMKPPVITPNNKNNNINHTYQKKAVPLFKESKIEIFSDHIERFVIASSIQDNEPVGTISDIIFDDTDIATVYAYSDINDLKDTTIYYQWVLDGQNLTKVRVDVGASRWRSYSSKFIQPDKHGKWEVVLQSEDGKKLASIEFIY